MIQIKQHGPYLMILNISSRTCRHKIYLYTYVCITKHHIIDVCYQGLYNFETNVWRYISTYYLRLHTMYVWNPLQQIVSKQCILVMSPLPSHILNFCRKESQSASSQSWGPVALHGTVPQSFNRLKVVNSGIEFWCSWGLPRCSGNTILGRKWRTPKLIPKCLFSIFGRCLLFLLRLFVAKSGCNVKLGRGIQKH